MEKRQITLEKSAPSEPVLPSVEYENADTQPVPLFNIDDILTVEKAPHTSSVNLGSLAVAKANPELYAKPGKELNPSLQEIKKSLEDARDKYAEEQDNAYNDLGGGLGYRRSAESRLNWDISEAIEASESWHTDIIYSVENLRFWELDSSDIINMNSRDRLEASKGIFSQLERMRRTAIHIGLCDGRIEGSHLEDRYGKRSIDEMLKYADLLKLMLSGAEKSGIAGAARSQLGIPSPRGNGPVYESKSNKAVVDLHNEVKKKGRVVITQKLSGGFEVGRVR